MLRCAREVTASDGRLPAGLHESHESHTNRSPTIPKAQSAWAVRSLNAAGMDSCSCSWEAIIKELGTAWEGGMSFLKCQRIAATHPVRESSETASEKRSPAGAARISRIGTNLFLQQSQGVLARRVGTLDLLGAIRVNS